MTVCSLDEAKRNPGNACDNTTTPDYVSLHPGYALEHPAFVITNMTSLNIDNYQCR